MYAIRSYYGQGLSLALLMAVKGNAIFGAPVDAGACVACVLIV